MLLSSRNTKKRNTTQLTSSPATISRSGLNGAGSPFFPFTPLGPFRPIIPWKPPSPISPASPWKGNEK